MSKMQWITYVLRAAHVCFTLAAPRFLWKRHVRPFWYYDGPTLALGAAAVLCTPSSAVSMKCSTCSRAGVMGYLFAQLSRKLSKKEVVFLPPQKPDFALAPVAFAEELIWRRGHFGVFDQAASAAAFGVLHYPLGGVKAVSHMTIFAAVSQWLKNKFGLGASATFHIIYNLYH